MARTKEERAAFHATLRGMAETAEREHPEAVAALAAILGNYSMRNAALIWSQCPDATAVAGFHDWRKAGRVVRKGEKGLAILAPMARKRDDGEEGTALAGFRVVYVFDVSQTEALAEGVAA